MLTPDNFAIFHLQEINKDYPLLVEKLLGQNKTVLNLFEDQNLIPSKFKSHPRVLNLKVPSFIIKRERDNWLKTVFDGITDNFSHDEVQVTSQLAARHGDENDTPSLLNAYNYEPVQNQLFGGLNISDVKRFDCPETSAMSLIKSLEDRGFYIPSNSSPVDILKLIDTIDDVKCMEAEIQGDGYMIRNGVLGDAIAIYVKKGIRSSGIGRVTLAHELGHILHGSDCANKDSDEELWCDKFAFSLLMSRVGIANLIRSGESLSSISKAYKVPIWAVRDRIIDVMGENDPDASELLLPSNMITTYVKLGRNIRWIARKHKVSVSAVRQRILSLMGEGDPDVIKLLMPTPEIKPFVRAKRNIQAIAGEFSVSFDVAKGRIREVFGDSHPYVQKYCT